MMGVEVSTMNTVSAAVCEPVVAISDAALARVRELAHEAGKPGLKLRVYIEGGGCSGFQYGFRLDEQGADDDYVLGRDGVELLVDPLSMPYLEGAEVDYVEQLSRAEFVIHNPNAKATCGCGTSFTA
jgi:iron-sulfur cluster insertion protein